jgi:hypothetical protein
VDKSEVPDNARIFGTKWVDEMRVVGEDMVPKSRLVIQGYNDSGKEEVLCASLTI